jgi:hypothetical protein
MGTMLGRKEVYRTPEGQKEWTVDPTLNASPTWGRGNWQFPSYI